MEKYDCEAYGAGCTQSVCIFFICKFISFLKVITYMVLSIISCLFALTLMSMSATAVGVDNADHHNYCDYHCNTWESCDNYESRCFTVSILLCEVT